MIDLLSEAHVRTLIKQRKQKFKLDNHFYVITPLNHIFKFWSDGDVTICSTKSNRDFYDSNHPEILKLYDAEYDSRSPYISDSATRKHLYKLFISDPVCLFFDDWAQLQQELQSRGLI